jgi:hypothetical protein
VEAVEVVSWSWFSRGKDRKRRGSKMGAGEKGKVGRGGGGKRKGK